MLQPCTLRHFAVVSLASVLLYPTTLLSQELCKTSTPVLSSGIGKQDVELPDGAATAFFVLTEKQPPERVPLGTLIGGSWTLDQSHVDRVAPQLALGPGRVIFVNKDGKDICARDFSLAVPGTGSGAAVVAIPGGALSAVTQEDCQAAAVVWEQELLSRPAHARGRFTQLVFLESGQSGSGNLCYFNRDYGVVGDPIYIGVFTNGAVVWRSATYEPCSLQSASPNVLQSGDKFPGTLQKGAARLQKFSPRRCFNTSVQAGIVGVDPQTVGGRVAQAIPLAQYDRYRGTIQAGVLFSKNRDASFALRSDQADTARKFIYDQGPSNTGPDYIATLQLYSVLRYLQDLRGKASYAGRDPIHDNAFVDRIGGILGVGLRNPGSRFAFGVSFEVLYGVSVVGVSDYAKVRGLDPSVALDKPFLGSVASIPTVLTWKQSYTTGLSIDLRFVSLLFSGNR